MLSCFTTEKNKKTIPITVIARQKFRQWLGAQSEQLKTWLQSTQFRDDLPFNDVRLIPNDKGDITRVICCVDHPEDMWGVGQLPMTVPEGVYELEIYESKNINKLYPIAWGLGAYQFIRYKKPLRQSARLYVPASLAIADIENIVSSIYLARDLTNTPTDDMGPSELAERAQQLASKFSARFKQIVGTDLLKQNYASIYTVGRASDDAPRLIDLRWGKKGHPQVTLVGKGVCFDSGGLDIKPSPYMLLMKKDMGGAAHVLALAQMIMCAKLPIQLRVLIPCVENVISGNAYRPGDIIKSRKGLTIEIGNTDAEGRVILADALTEAVSEKPKLLIDFATLTGAARVALGTDLPAVFSNNDKLVKEVMASGEKTQDLMWHMPLYKPYREYLVSQIADINNNPNDPYGGAIVAALFLKEFVPDDIPWLHFDMMAWNTRPRPGRPIGAEALTLRALFAYLQMRFV